MGSTRKRGPNTSPPSSKTKQPRLSNTKESTSTSQTTIVLSDAGSDTPHPTITVNAKSTSSNRSNLTSRINSRSGTKTSWVWRYFKKEIVIHPVTNEEEERTICTFEVAPGKECKSSYKVDQSSSTKSMSRHLLKHGLDEDSHIEEGAVDMRKYLTTGRITTVDKLSNSTFRSAILRLIVNEELPFSLVESEDLRNTFLLVNPNIRPYFFGHTTLTDTLKAQFIKGRRLLTHRLKDIPYINFTCDGWSQHNKSILGVTAHWVSKDFELCEAIIGMKLIKGPHTGENLSEHLLETLKTYDLVNKLFCLTADNASVNTVMGRHLEAAVPQFKADQHLLGCMAHVINLVAKAGLHVFSEKLGDKTPSIPPALAAWLHQDTDRISSALSRLIGFTNYVEASPQRVKSFSLLVKGMLPEKDHVRLIRRVDTRWNSDFEAHERSYRLRDAIDFRTKNDREYAKFALTEGKWDLVAHLIAFLAPLNTATKILSGSQYPTTADAAPVYQWILEKLDKAWKGNANEPLRAAIGPMRIKLQEYHQAALKKPAYLFANILDPRSKLLELSTATIEMAGLYDREDLQSKFIREAANFQEEQSETVEDPESEVEEDGPRRFISRKKKLTVEEEVEMYLSSGRADQSVVPLDFWGLHAGEFPTLARMAAAYLSIPATSTPSERSFSSGGRVWTDERATIDELNFEASICLKSWNKILLFNSIKTT